MNLLMVFQALKFCTLNLNFTFQIAVLLGPLGPFFLQAIRAIAPFQCLFSFLEAKLSVG